MALVGGHAGPGGYQSIFAGHRPFAGKSGCTALQPTSATLGHHAAKLAVGSGHSEVAEAVGRGRMSPTPSFLTLCLWGWLKICSRACRGQRHGVRLERRAGDQKDFVQLLHFMVLWKVLKG